MTSGLTNRATGGDHPGVPERTAPVDAATADLSTFPGADSWRVEVAARVERYRTRRKPRTPRYPSLLLPFDAPESWSRPAPQTGLAGTGSAAGATSPAQIEQDFGRQAKDDPAAVGTPSFDEPRPVSDQAPYRYPEESAKVIEFPRSAAVPVFRASQLADPVFDYDRPRIVEAPEMLPPPPALGGMLIESADQEPADESAPASACPSASIARRTLAAFVDGVVLATALAAFAAIFLRLNPSLNSTLNLSLSPVRGPLPMFGAALGLIALLLWMVYEFLFVVYTGSTPGLRAARLRLAGFEGLPLNRRARRWRVLASFLSAFSAGLGYFWCVLDQDGLCWHDRITRTHVQPESPPE